MTNSTGNLVIVGFQKAGTTSIKNYLSQHSLILGHASTEMTYFSNESEYNAGFKAAHKGYYSQTPLEGYRYLLTKHATLIRKEENIKRLKDFNPQSKILVCMRDPVIRAFSSYLMERTNGSIGEVGFSEIVTEAFASESSGNANWHYNVFIRLGQYADYIEILLRYFSKSQILFLFIEDFKKNPEGELRTIVEWLNLSWEDSINLKKEHNTFKGSRSKTLNLITKLFLNERSVLKRIAKKVLPIEMQNSIGEGIRNFNKVEAKKPELEELTRIRLSRHYKPYNLKLAQLLKRDLPF